MDGVSLGSELFMFTRDGSTSAIPFEYTAPATLNTHTIVGLRINESYGLRIVRNGSHCIVELGTPKDGTTSKTSTPQGTLALTFAACELR